MASEWQTALHGGERYKVLCRTNRMLADLFTKNLPAQTFNALADYITGRRGDYSAEPLLTEDGRAMLVHRIPE